MKKNTLIIACVLIAIVIDTMGMGLVFPLLPDLFFNTHSLLLPVQASLSTRDFVYGLSLALWAGGIFFGSPFLGELSDRYGRKRVLAGSLGMVALSYLLSLLSLFLGSGLLFLASRLLNGFFSSSFPLAQAVIIDTSPIEVRARNLGWVVLAASIGFVFGPLLSGSAYHFAGPAHGAEVAFLSASVLSGLNTLGIAILLKETDQHLSHRPIRILSVITTCEFVFTDRRVWFLSLIFFLMQLGWGTYIQTIPVILAQKFFFSPIAISLFYAALGGAFLVMTLWIQPFLLRKFALKKLCFVGLLGMILCFLISLFAVHQEVLWGAMILLAFSDCLVYTTMISLFSEAVNNDEQGRVMGGMGAIFGLTWGILALCLGGMLQWSLIFPLGVGTVGTFLAATFVLRYRNHARTS